MRMPKFTPTSLPEDKEGIMRGDINAKEHVVEYSNGAFSPDAEYHPRGGRRTAKFADYSSESSDDEAKNESYSVDEDDNNSAQEFTDNITEAAAIPLDPEQTQSKTEKEKAALAWDNFQVTSRDNFFDDEKQTMDILRKILKVVVAVLLIIFVLGCAVVSKVTFFMIEANLNTTARYLGNRNETTDGHIPVQWIWSAMLVICFPYILIFVKCFWRLCFKKTHEIRCRTLVVQIILETVHTVGLVSLVFLVIPRLDIFRGILIMTGVGVIPSILKIFDVPPLPINDGTMEQTTKKKASHIKARRNIAYVIDILSCMGQVSALIIWPLTEYFNGQQELDVVIILPISLVFISVNWWENYVTKISKDKFFFGALYEHKKAIRKQRTKLSLVICLWKIALTLLTTGILFGIGDDCLETFLFRRTGTSNCDLTKTGVSNFNNTYSLTVAFVVAAVNMFSSWLCYLLAKTACKVLLQIPSFALPLILVTPCSLIIVGSRFTVNWDLDVFPDPSILDLEKYLMYLFEVHYVPVVVVWFLSFIAVVGHIIRPKTERLAQTDKLFVQHLYCGVFVDMSIMLNRRRDEADFQSTTVKKKKETSPIKRVLDESDPQFDPMNASHLSKNSTPMIYLCATMWHESENEMLQILKSLFRMDVDQSARKNMQLYFEIPDPDYYEFEGHIFFDDAFEAHTDEEQEYNANSFVKQLVTCIDIAASAVHRVPIEVGAPKKYPTPYGGRLEWKLPGENKLIAHLKDKAKIRHRKRWSQVMYMYYFLGHQLLNTNRTSRRMRTKAENTFLLALDGDVDFEPYAVQLLVDRMKKNEKVGAACGRIHPIGSGPMVWYQKFEYAISHWLQKATEHMIGCVLCSPGCFSMFRGSSLMDDNVMARYTTPPSEARHYVQYDQGEDRWLCTLLLQQGYRVEYCAASDALTYAPEGFNEYYNQRRRWTPSTMANILDLLSDWKSVIRLNENISCLYIIYQGVMMVSSILTPGTVFLLVLGAINAAFPEISLVASLLVNLFPVALFLLLCFVAKGSIQLAYAGVLSGIYSLAMMIVLVGLILQIAEHLYCSPTALFLAFIVGVFLIAAILHPQEFTCLIFGALYFLAIPSMSMLLMIYSLGNLHVVSWGTREVRQAVAPQQQQQEQEKGKAKKDGKLQSVLNKVAKKGEVSDYEFSFGNLFKCLCCPKHDLNKDDERFKTILERIDRMEESRVSIPVRRRQRFDSDQYNNAEETSKAPAVNFSEASEYFEGAEIKENPIYQAEKRDDMVTPFWIEDPDMRNGKIDKISEEEVTFWKDLITKYLLPIEGNKEQQAQMAKDLIELRNKVCLFYFLINAIFVTIVFTLQYVNGQTHSIAVVIACGEDNITLEPISIVFMAVFGMVLFIQFIAMIFHRLATFLHIVATVDIRIFRKKADASAVGELKGSDALELVRELQRLDTTSEDDDTKSIASSFADSEFDGDTLRNKAANDQLFRRFTKKRPTGPKTGTLGKMFQKRMQSLKEMPMPEPDADYVETDELYNKTIRNKQKISRKSYKTMINIMQNPERKKTVQSKWKRFADLAKVKNAGGQGARKSTLADVVRLVVDIEKAKEPQLEDVAPLEGANGGPEDIDMSLTGRGWNNPSRRSTELQLADSSTDFDAPINLLPGEGLTSL